MGIITTTTKLYSKDRVTIKAGSVVEIEVDGDYGVMLDYAQFFLRKSFAVKGLLQVVHTPFPHNWCGIPTVVVHNVGVSDFELLTGEELGEMWEFGSECEYE